jgi:hypothetical protein
MFFFFILCILCFVLFLYCSAYFFSFCAVSKPTLHCYWVENQLQKINIISYHNHHSVKLKLGLLLGYIKSILRGNQNLALLPRDRQTPLLEVPSPVKKTRNLLHSKHLEIALVGK